MKYRPEIDGLRAIAVLAVVFCHYPVLGTFNGGLLGVDVFFVISGYLITSILLRELKAGTFSVWSFWERRARRILPALFVVLLATTVLAHLYTEDSLRFYAKGLITTVLFSYNFFAWYHASVHHTLAHTWTLAVEEQFYVLFPLALLLLWKHAKQHITLVFVLGILSSLLAMHFFHFPYAQAVFHILPTRMWELLAGALLAQLEMSRGRKKSSLGGIFCAIGVLLIAYGTVSWQQWFGPPYVPYASVSYVLVVLGTMLIIWFGGYRDYVSKILSSTPFVAVGLISYSLYLWNWPIKIVAYAYRDDFAVYELWAMILLSFVLSGVTWLYVERPFRDRRRVSRRALFCFLLPTTSLLLGWAIYVIYS